MAFGYIQRTVQPPTLEAVTRQRSAGPSRRATSASTLPAEPPQPIAGPPTTRSTSHAGSLPPNSNTDDSDLARRSNRLDLRHHSQPARKSNMLDLRPKGKVSHLVDDDIESAEDEDLDRGAPPVTPVDLQLRPDVDNHSPSPPLPDAFGSDDADMMQVHKGTPTYLVVMFKMIYLLIIVMSDITHQSQDRPNPPRASKRLQSAVNLSPGQ
jgi:hypothetical protein